MLFIDRYTVSCMEVTLELVPIFTTALIVALSGAMMPGPLLTVTISETAKKGQKAAVLLIIGHSILELILVIGFTLGIYAVLKSPVVIRAIGVLGGGFLLWMGYGLAADSYRGRVSLDLTPGEGQLALGPVVQGVVTSLSNPYWTLWWVTIGAGFVLSSLKHGVPGLTSFYVGHILGDFLWYAAVAYVVATGKRFITDTVYRGVLFACGLFLMLLAMTFVLDLPLF